MMCYQIDGKRFVTTWPNIIIRTFLGVMLAMMLVAQLQLHLNLKMQLFGTPLRIGFFLSEKLHDSKPFLINLSFWVLV